MISASVGPTTTTARSSGRSAATSPAHDLGDPAGQAALDDHDPGAGVGEDVAEELALVRGVDRHLDRAELQRREEADDLLGRVLEQRRDPVAPADAELGEPVGDAVRRARSISRAVSATPVEVQVAAVRDRRRAALASASSTVVSGRIRAMDLTLPSPSRGRNRRRGGRHARPAW